MFHGLPLRTIGDVVRYKFHFPPEEPRVTVSWMAFYGGTMFTVWTGPNPPVGGWSPPRPHRPQAHRVFRPQAGARFLLPNDEFRRPTQSYLEKPTNRRCWSQILVSEAATAGVERG